MKAGIKTTDVYVYVSAANEGGGVGSTKHDCCNQGRSRNFFLSCATMQISINCFSMKQIHINWDI